MRNLDGKCVVITGAGSGIGRALSILCSQYGSKIAICDRNSQTLDETSRLIREGAIIACETLDVSNADAMDIFASKIAQCGGADVLINNAGISFTQVVERSTREEFQNVFNVNYFGVVNGCLAFLPQLRLKPEAHIVNISSLFGLLPVPTQSAYVASKFAVRGFTESLEIELSGSSVGVTCVFPGGVQTGIARNGIHHSASLGTDDPKDLIDLFERIALTTPEEAAQKIIRAILRRKNRSVVGFDALIIDLISRLSPSLSKFLVTRISKNLISRNERSSKKIKQNHAA